MTMPQQYGWGDLTALGREYHAEFVEKYGLVKLRDIGVERENAERSARQREIASTIVEYIQPYLIKIGSQLLNGCIIIKEKKEKDGKRKKRILSLKDVSIPLEDLVSEASCVLFRKVGSYNSRYSISSWVRIYGAGTMYKYGGMHSGIIHVPTGKKTTTARKLYHSSTTRAEALHKIRDFLKNSPKRTNKKQKGTKPEDSKYTDQAALLYLGITNYYTDLFAPLREEDGYPYKDTFEGRYAEDPDAMDHIVTTALNQMLLQKIMKDTLATLDEREQYVLKMRYGLEKDGKEMSFTEVGTTLCLSKDSIRKIEINALKKLRIKLL